MSGSFESAISLMRGFAFHSGADVMIEGVGFR